MFDIARQRGTVREQLRIADLMSLTPKGKRVLEIGARDCYLSRKLTALYPEVVALDLTKPEIDAPGITAVQGDVTGLRFANNAFDTVFCTEVLEHVPPEKLQQACNEIVRVASRYAVIGVPYRQDLRANRTRCLRCGAVNPTTGHLNRFDRQRLTALFPGMTPREIRLTGRGQAVTNPLSVRISLRQLRAGGRMHPLRRKTRPTEDRPNTMGALFRRTRIEPDSVQTVRPQQADMDSYSVRKDGLNRAAW